MRGGWRWCWSWPHNRGYLGRFLADLRIGPTHNRAERALHSAVIARKVSQCANNGRGAHTCEAGPCVVRTRLKNGAALVGTGLDHRFHAQRLQAVLPDPVVTCRSATQ